MVKIDLITGFLGSGKTTFLIKYAEFLMGQGLRVGILENDYGAVNVDMMLLQNIKGDNYDLEMVAGGCDADCHRRRFKTKLIAMGMSGYDRVIIEPSGIFDVDEFFDALCEEPLSRWFEIGSVIAIVDPEQTEGLSIDSRYLLASETACAGMIVVSKAQMVDYSQIAYAVKRVDEALAEFKCDRCFTELKDNEIRLKPNVLCKNWDDFTDREFCMVKDAGYSIYDIVKSFSEDDISFDSLYYMNVRVETDELKRRISSLFSDGNYGSIFRVKGFMKQGDGFIMINATEKSISFSPIEKGQEIIIVIGENMNKDLVNSLFPESKY